MRTSSQEPPRDVILENLVLRYAKPWEHLSEAEERNAIELDRRETDEAFVQKIHRPHLNPKKGPQYRYLMPENIRIPWPTAVERKWQDEEADTARTLVEERSFLPTLLRPPMPEGVIDELRNKYGLFRVRHDDEYVAAKEKEDADAEEERKLVEMMKGLSARNIARPPPRSGARRTPQDPAKMKQREEDMLALLGSHIASKRRQEMPGNQLFASTPPPTPASLDTTLG